METGLVQTLENATLGRGRGRPGGSEMVEYLLVVYPHGDLQDIQSSGWPPVRLTGRPYLSIAGGLTEKVYNKAMPDYSRRTFHDVFQVRELVLLRRRHSFDPCKTVNVFGLKS